LLLFLLSLLLLQLLRGRFTQLRLHLWAQPCGPSAVHTSMAGLPGERGQPS